MDLRPRKLLMTSEEIHSEIGRSVSPPLRLCIAAAVLTNPWAGRGYVEDLQPEIRSIAPALGRLLVPALGELLGGMDNLEAYGKAAVVGLDGELEHASALIHTLRFGNIFRAATGGTTFLPFTNRRGSAGSPIQIPLMHKDDPGWRTHYLTAETVIADAPGPDEIVIAIAGSSGGRPFARIGNRYEDERDLAAETAARGAG